MKLALLLRLMFQHHLAGDKDRGADLQNFNPKSLAMTKRCFWAWMELGHLREAEYGRGKLTDKGAHSQKRIGGVRVDGKTTG